MPPRMPKIHLQPPSVDFIDHHMADHHDAFRNPEARYDASLGRYVPAPKVTALLDASCTPQALLKGSSENVKRPCAGQDLVPRPLLPEIEAMAFWGYIFDDSLQRFKSKYPEAPKGRLDSAYNIRSATDWETIYAQLQLAREVYDGTKKGFRGRVKSISRKVADNTGLASHLIKFIPDGTYTSPVRAAVEVLLDAIKIASSVRKNIEKSFDGQSLDQTFGDVEVFLMTFPQDENIKKASKDLIVATFKAIEDTIGFFIQHSVTRGISAVVHVEKYQETVLESIEMVYVCSKDLIHQALNSHITSTREAMTATLQRTSQIETLQEKTIEAVESLKDGDAHLLNLVQKLLDDAEKNRETKLEMLKEIADLKQGQNQIIRQLTPTPQHGMPMPPLLQASTQPLGQWLPGHIYQPQPVLFYAGPSYLPTFASPTQPFVFAPSPEPCISRSDLRDYLRIADFDESDMVEITESKDRIPVRYRREADQIASTWQFQNWMVTAASQELLVQGVPTFDPDYALALSGLSAMLTSAVKRRARYICLVFFCGLHAESDAEYTGGTALIRSLIAQLLRYHPYDTTLLHREIDLGRVQTHDLGQLCVLFRWLVERLPRTVTLFCIVDGIGCYENDEYQEDMQVVLQCILNLSRDTHLPAAVKVLATSASPTDAVLAMFKEDDACFLSMAELRANPESSLLQLGGGDDDDECDGF